MRVLLKAAVAAVCAWAGLSHAADSYGEPGVYTFVGDCTGCLSPQIKVQVFVDTAEEARRVAIITGLGFSPPLRTFGYWLFDIGGPGMAPAAGIGGNLTPEDPLVSLPTPPPGTATGNLCSGWNFIARSANWEFGNAWFDDAQVDGACADGVDVPIRWNGTNGAWSYSAPVPEPQAVALFGLGLLLVLRVAHRRHS